MALLTMSVLCAVAAASSARLPPYFITLAGSTTLGCYVIHLYFTLPIIKAPLLPSLIPSPLSPPRMLALSYPPYSHPRSLSPITIDQHVTAWLQGGHHILKCCVHS